MNSESNKEYSVNWKNHMSHVRKAFDYLLSSSELTDVTLCCDGKKIGAHKMLLSACSAYFRDIFKEVPCQHPVIILYGVEYGVLSDILHFIYNGEVSVDTAKLDSFLKTAQLLQISGLTDDTPDTPSADNQTAPESAAVNDVYAEPVAESSRNEEQRKPVKRLRVSEAEPTRDALRQENDTMFISDVKCEPSELMSVEDPLEDPLESEQAESKEFYGAPGVRNSGEGEFKFFPLMRRRPSPPYKEQRLDGKFHVLGIHPEGKRKDCVVCSNRKLPGSRKVTAYLCETCHRLPSLHVGECFRKYHTLDYYRI